MVIRKDSIPNEVRNPGFARDYAFCQRPWGGAVLQHSDKNAPRNEGYSPRGSSVLQLRSLASVHNLCRINRILIHLLFQNFPIFSNQEVHPARRFIFIYVDSILPRYVPTPITQQGKCNSNLIGEGFVGEGTIHAHTQDLGVGSFQPFLILLESFHLGGSTAGEREDEEGHYNILVAAVLT
jgi:hypothetical protein